MRNISVSKEHKISLDIVHQLMITSWKNAIRQYAQPDIKA